MTQKQNQGLYTLHYLDIHLAEVQRTAKLILENLWFFELKNQRKREQWWRLRVNEHEYIYNRSLSTFLEFLLQMSFLSKENYRQFKSKLVAASSPKLNGAVIIEKIWLLGSLVTAYLDTVKNEFENKSVLNLKLETGDITFSQWSRYFNQVINLDTRLQSFSFCSLMKEINSEKPSLPEQLPDFIERDFKLISRKILHLERALAGIRYYAAHLDFYINVHGTGVDDVADKDLSTWKLKYQFLTYLIDLILAIRLVGKKNPPKVREYDWQMPERLTIGFMQRISNRFVKWLERFREWVLEIDETIVLYRISTAEQYSVFFENWTRFKNAFLPLKDAIDLEMALIECRQPGWLRRYAEKTTKKRVHHNLAG